MDDLTLLRTFEPVVCFTEGELFAPCSVDEYVSRCSLWVRDEEGHERQIVEAQNVSTENLGQLRDVPAGSTYHLRFVEEPLQALEYRRWRQRPDKPKFLSPGRLARVGLLSRIIDFMFNLSLLLRGKVPGGTTAAAEIGYREIFERDPRYVYYGRVVRSGGYIILHYLFFYVMNDWRSSFHGVNDHEADWEQIFIYLSDEEETGPQPVWIGYASHDHEGDDLRRRWDDPELHKHDNHHPIIYVGAGSHASYFLPGEYQMSVEPSFLLPIKNAIQIIKKYWAEQLGQGRTEQTGEGASLVTIPFIDFARGDGLRIGPGQGKEWDPILITEDMSWVTDYRGLWGLDTKDPFGGERAPAGPKYNRDGSIRHSWYDPLGWAGLDKVPPPHLLPGILNEKIKALQDERDEVERDLIRKREELRLLSLEIEALHESECPEHFYQSRLELLREKQRVLRELSEHHAVLIESLAASRDYREKIERGDWGDPQSHVRHKSEPQPPPGKRARITEFWAAVSGGLLLLSFTSLLILAPSDWPIWAIIIGSVFATLEATAQHRLENFLLNTTIILSIFTSLILIKDLWWLIMIAALFILVLGMIADNLRELWGS